MENDTIIALIEADDEVREWLIAAAEQGWGSLDDLCETAVRVHGEITGMHRCGCCDDCVADVSLELDEDSTAIPVADDYLCRDCYAAANAARQKIVVTIDEDGRESEDRSALTPAEAILAGYLDSADEDESRQERGIAASYPRGERGQVMRYAALDARDRRLAGKTVVRE